jgi:hypothetical protein
MVAWFVIDPDDGRGGVSWEATLMLLIGAIFSESLLNRIFGHDNDLSVAFLFNNP